MDFWWQDGHIRGAMSGLDGQLWTNDCYQRFQRHVSPTLRPMVFSRFPGTGAHRYPFHFSGDLVSQWECLAHSAEFTVRAGHQGLSFVTHDIGGHFFAPCESLDPELYARWVQFGAMSPMLRLHSGSGNERRPWCYPRTALTCARKAMQWRQELLPYLYTLAWETHAKLLPMVRSAVLAFPDWPGAEDVWHAYALGDRIWCTPALDRGTVHETTLPPGKWYSGLDDTIIEGDRPIKLRCPLDAPPPHFIKAGTVLPRQPFCHRASAIPDTLYLDWYDLPEAEDSFTLYEDDGLGNDYENGEACRTRIECKRSADQLTLTIHPAAAMPANRRNGPTWCGCTASQPIQQRAPWLALTAHGRPQPMGEPRWIFGCSSVGRFHPDRSPSLQSAARGVLDPLDRPNR